MASKELEINEDDFLKIKEILKFVWESPLSSFYRDKYGKAGVDPTKNIRTVEDFKELPYLTKEEILAVRPYDRLFLPKKEIDHGIFSSGTTGGNIPTIVFNDMNPNRIALTLEEIKKEDASVYLFLYPALTLQYYLLAWAEIYKKNGILPVGGDINNLPLTAKIASFLEIDAIQTNPTILYYFLPHLKAVYDLNKIKFIRIGGEYCSEAKAKILKDSFPKARIAFSFGGTGTGKLGYRCHNLDDEPPRFFHPAPGYLPEIDDSTGEMIFTHLDTRGVFFPLIRYKTGDVVRVESRLCPCGNDRRLEVFGRLDYEMARVHGASIYSSEVAKALEPVQFYLASPDWQLHIYEENDGGNVMIRLVLRLVPTTTALVDEAGAKKRIADEINRNLRLGQQSTLADLVRKNIFLPLEIEFASQLPFVPKQKHIISHLV